MGGQKGGINWHKQTDLATRTMDLAKIVASLQPTREADLCLESAGQMPNDFLKLDNGFAMAEMSGHFFSCLCT